MLSDTNEPLNKLKRAEREAACGAMEDENRQGRQILRMSQQAAAGRVPGTTAKKNEEQISSVGSTWRTGIACAFGNARPYAKHAPLLLPLLVFTRRSIWPLIWPFSPRKSSNLRYSASYQHHLVHEDQNEHLHYIDRDIAQFLMFH